ncbi:hypothetical protein [Candidatus Synchoanobacter obligatus]|uniref:Uncharacterized protein n=1 Tax=Candidatus Synchoanobacter obligatus TaxID=2919597 RepID=A0ABT1L591_9GAMM|nr:hypothetical protein [Candidatus Synchoanobacter obligatus]MCP8352028.1 hypothetical protein [Candidatus Synchoanobacter obligatus]
MDKKYCVSKYVARQDTHLSRLCSAIKDSDMSPLEQEVVEYDVSDGIKA